MLTVTASPASSIISADAPSSLARGASLCWNGPGTLASSPIALSKAPGVTFPVSFELAVGGGGANSDSACVL